MNLEEFLVQFRQIRESGFVEAHREHDTAIGKTLEDLLGIAENNIAGPDFDVYELKSQRKLTSSLMTLFTKVPQPKGANCTLLNKFGYKTREVVNGRKERAPPTPDPNLPSREKELHATVVANTKNSVGLWLERRGNRIYVANDAGVEVYYEEDYLRQAFEKKYSHKLLYVLADNKRERGRLELFHYTDVYLLEGFSFKGFSEQIDRGVIKLDIRLGHYADGRPHDHGTGFRIFPRDFPQCFATNEKLV